jgi:hypothetical protein
MATTVVSFGERWPNDVHTDWENYDFTVADLSCGWAHSSGHAQIFEPHQKYNDRFGNGAVDG